MKTFRNFIALSFAILAFSLVGVNAQNTNRSTQTIERQVFKKLLGLPYYGVFDHIAFEVRGSTVILQGKVNNGVNKSDAAAAVKRVPGVEKVINNIRLLPPSSFDDSIRRQTLRSFSTRGGSLYRYLLEPNPSMRIIVENGRVSLEGFVASRSDANLANILANGIPGVFEVRNNLIVGKGEAR
jgi:hyperosmotically inducible periplasmic protein